jgi:hypothetical protein
MHTRAIPLIGGRIETIQKYAGVPKGTEGKVVRIENGTDIVIEWNLPQQQPFIDWFTHDEYNKYFREV